MLDTFTFAHYLPTRCNTLYFLRAVSNLATRPKLVTDLLRTRTLS